MDGMFPAAIVPDSHAFCREESNSKSLNAHKPENDRHFLLTITSGNALSYPLLACQWQGKCGSMRHDRDCAYPYPAHPSGPEAGAMKDIDRPAFPTRAASGMPQGSRETQRFFAPRAFRTFFCAQTFAACRSNPTGLTPSTQLMRSITTPTQLRRPHPLPRCLGCYGPAVCSCWSSPIRVLCCSGFGSPYVCWPNRPCVRC